MKSYPLTHRSPNLLWLMIGLKELWQNTKADFQNRSVLLALVALVILPVDTLPILYVDWVDTLSTLFMSSKQTDLSNGLGFSAVLLLGLIFLSFWRRGLFGEFSKVSQLEITLPIPKYFVVLNQFFLGLFCNLPFLLILFIGAAISIYSKKIDILNIKHILALFAFLLMSAIATGVTVLYSKASNLAASHKTISKRDNFTFYPKSITWLFFLARRLVEKDQPRILSFFSIFAFFSFIICKKSDSELMSYGLSGLVVFSSLCSYYLLWFLKPLLNERKLYQDFLSTTPSALSSTHLGEYIIGMGLLITALIPFAIRLHEIETSPLRIFIAVIDAVALNTISFLSNLYLPRLCLLVLFLTTTLILYIF